MIKVGGQSVTAEAINSCDDELELPLPTRHYNSVGLTATCQVDDSVCSPLSISSIFQLWICFRLKRFAKIQCDTVVRWMI